MSETQIIPTVGRVVHFKGDDDIIRAAQISRCFVTTPDLVNLYVIGVDGNDTMHGHHISVQRSPGHTSVPSWDWMPYQKGQAAKTEQLEKSMAQQIREAGPTPTKFEVLPMNPSRPTVTKEQVMAIIDASIQHDTKVGNKTTVVCLILPNGFEVIESSGCVDPANYNHSLGVETCLRRIVDKIWLLEGYLLQSRISDAPKINLIAKACHEANRRYCASIGDDSQVPWDKASHWQKESAANGVVAIISNPIIGPEDLHKSWLDEKVRTGWMYGEVKDPDKKTHPCMVPYDQLPAEQREKDAIFGRVARFLLGLPNPSDIKANS